MSRTRSSHFVSSVAWSCYLFLLLPSLIVIPISFGNPAQIEFPPRQFSLALYQRFLAEPSWWGSMVQSLVVAGLVTVISIVLAVPAAYAIARTRLAVAAPLRGLFMLPMLVPIIVLGLGLYLEYSRLGLLDTTAGVVAAHVMLAAPFVMVSVTAGLRHADINLEKVALIMGASRMAVFFRVVLPQLRTSIAVGAMFAFLTSLDEVVVAYFITGTKSLTLPVKMYSSIRWELSPVIAAVSTVLTVLSLAVALAIIAVQRPAEQSP